MALEANELDSDRVKKDLISNTLDMKVVRYSKVWEDHAVLTEGLQIGKEDVVLCITSSGDNVLNFLLKEPKEIYAVDLSEAQNAVLELKIAAIKGLDSHEEFLQLLGELDCSDRGSLYRKIEDHLPKYAKDFWRENLTLIDSGLAWSGRLEKYTYDLSAVHCKDFLSPEMFDQFFCAPNMEEQRRAFNELPLQEYGKKFRWYTSKEVMGKFGRSNAQFSHVEMSSDEVGQETWKRLVQLCESVPAKNNFYLSWWVRGDYGLDPVKKPDFAPPFLTKDGFLALKGLVDKVKLFTGSLDEFLMSQESRKITKLSLSNIFEYLSVSATQTMFEMIAKNTSPGALVAYWELYLNRKPSPEEGRMKYLQELSERLGSKSRVFWFQNRFRLYEIK